MLNYEHKLLVQIAINFARRATYPSDRATRIIDEVRRGDSFEELRQSEKTKKILKGLEENWYEVKHALDLLKEATADIELNTHAERIRQLGEILKLEKQDVEILEMLHFSKDSDVEEFIDEVTPSRRFYGNFHVNDAVLPLVLGTPSKALNRRFQSDKPLSRMGLISIDDHDGEIIINDCLKVLRFSPDENVDVRELILGKAQDAELSWSDFDYLGKQRDDVERILKGAIQAGATGLNILIHGPSGAGKTTFAKVLAERVQAPLFCIGEGDDDSPPSSRERLSDLSLAQSLLKDNQKAILLFDEMEDVLSDDFSPMGFFSGFNRRRKSPSKVHMNRLLERTPVPTIWIVNNAACLDKPIVRRMNVAMEFCVPPKHVRAGIFSTQFNRHGIELSEEQALKVAHQFDATPGLIEGAAVASKLGNGDLDLALRSLRSVSDVLGWHRPASRDWGEFDPVLVNADIDLDMLTESLVKSGKREVSFCLQGPPGTGKSAFVRHLASQLDMEVQHERASDLLSKWVGETEQTIARAFQRARENKAFLVFDEADSLLSDRGSAMHNWEVSQVNEMLTWMESHPLPFACTTNNPDALDAATLRRFIFKVNFDYLTSAGVKAAFNRWFGFDAPSDLSGLDMLTPADFEVVHRKAEFLDQLDDVEAVVKMLRNECEVKPDRTSSFGFGSQMSAT